MWRFVSMRWSIWVLTVLIGLQWSPAGGVVGDSGSDSTAAKTQHWSLQPIRRSLVPPVRLTGEWVRNGTDAFVARRLRAEAIRPAPTASRVTQLRRVTLDLIGLPPEPDEVDQFLNDRRPGAYERAVDRLLASPHFGEKWARSWLDLCHYADTDGYLTDQLRPVAWRYRAWLVSALNANMSFDRFTREQIAGDLEPRATIEQRIAAGFLRQTLSDREGGADLEEFRVKQVVDRTEMVGAIWLGLTVGCARCHDHKYDPISQQEFFELYACMNNADEVNIDAPLPAERRAWAEARPKYEARRRKLIAPLRTEVEKLQRRWEQRCLRAWKNPGEVAIWDRQWEVLGLVWGGGLGEGQLEGCEIAKLKWSQRTARQQDDLLDYFLDHGAIVDPQEFNKLKLGSLSNQLKKLKREFPQATRAPTMRAAQTPRQTYIHERGEFRDRGADVRPGTLGCLPAWQPSHADPRRNLAEWLVSDTNPLTARVIVNRIWQELFGRGLVRTTEDFGTRGERPSHPELLDWLASEFVRSGWDVKQLLRCIVTSATYRQSSGPRPELRTLDPQNTLLARQNALRVPAEMVRDLGLAASGLLYRKMGGPSVRPPQPERVTLEAFGRNDWKPSAAPERYRRGLYTFIIRTAPFAQSATFDAPNPNEICTRRERSNTPLQALTLLNDPVFFEMAQALAERVLRKTPTPAAGDIGPASRVDYAFRLCTGRRPRSDERRHLLEFLKSQQQLFAAQPEAAGSLITYEFPQDTPPHVAAAWTNLCSVLLNLHEFITRD